MYALYEIRNVSLTHNFHALFTIDTYYQVTVMYHNSVLTALNKYMSLDGLFKF